MTQAEKDLLLRDLCARLPYGVVIQEKCVEQDETFLPNKEGDRLVNIDAHADLLMTNCGSWYYLDEVKPYLFPHSSMSEWQDRELEILMKNSIESCGMLSPYDCLEMERFFNENHLDWRGLIPMGLAIDATGLNIY
jgi:hypothetical protein